MGGWGGGPAGLRRGGDPQLCFCAPTDVFLHGMVLFAGPPNLPIFVLRSAALSHGCRLLPWVQAAESAWADAQAARVRPDLLLFTAMIDSCAKVGSQLGNLQGFRCREGLATLRSVVLQAALLLSPSSTLRTTSAAGAVSRLLSFAAAVPCPRGRNAGLPGAAAQPLAAPGCGGLHLAADRPAGRSAGKRRVGRGRCVGWDSHGLPPLACLPVILPACHGGKRMLVSRPHALAALFFEEASTRLPPYCLPHPSPGALVQAARTAREVWARMRADGVQPNGMAVAAFLEILLLEGEIDEALQVGMPYHAVLRCTVLHC